ncbi:uncharacterized protein LOC110447847 [Mizuhopecten yessoensis]|uniref:Uncharacterized protein n=1 Tax=Mizuhopecten yessoensis TaxID=6573 RepID=A0A210QUJ7_MIZYE|nr:uncharacterized protein LOC110447847 [Mizuhopecten yessoensis]OWF52362.1 hypothetical protein KP79_PYT18530 [Mizuhopecten yessoensis]
MTHLAVCVRRMPCLLRMCRCRAISLQAAGGVCGLSWRNNRQFNMSTVTTSGSWLNEILEDQSTQKYYIENKTFRSNHIAHGIIAIDRLGGGQDRVKRFIDDYGNQGNLEPPNHPLHSDESTDAEPATDDELHKLLGQRKLYYKIRNRFNMKQQEYGSMEEMLREEFPRLSRGLVCSAIHGLIHTGYGYSAKSLTTVTEGLAYLHHSYKPLMFDEMNPDNDISNFGKGETDILAVLAELKDDEQLRKSMRDGVKKLSQSDWDSGQFQYAVAALMGMGDVLMKYAYKIKVPVISNCEDEASLAVAVSDWLVDQAIAVYALSEQPNNFFLVHGVTSAWSLRQIITVLKPPDAIDTLRTFTCVLLAAYLSQECPALTNKPKITRSAVTTSDWQDIVNKTLSRDCDEHIFKLVQVCRDMWHQENGSDKADLYLHAAQQCVDNDLSFVDINVS